MIKLTQDTRPDDVVDFEKPEVLGDVRAWSYSALKVYEECAYRTYISRVKGVKEPSGPAADRGTQIDLGKDASGVVSLQLYWFCLAHNESS